MKQIHLTIVLLAIASCLLGSSFSACGGTTPAPSPATATDLCASAVALSPEVRDQAAKLQRDPLAFAHELCAAVVLAAQVVKVNLPAKEPAAAGARAVEPSPIAGAAGAP